MTIVGLVTILFLWFAPVSVDHQTEGRVDQTTQNPQYEPGITPA